MLDVEMHGVVKTLQGKNRQLLQLPQHGPVPVMMT
jgi:hypothetical protein